jgi:predicted Fe-Mo cluster-binding NifX family protein
MKIAISSTSEKIDGQIDENFGRCPYFIIAEIKGDKIEDIEVIKNENINQFGGVGISTTQLIANKKVEAVITANVGPRALDVLNQLKIRIYIAKGNIKEAIQDLIDDKLKELK